MVPKFGFVAGSTSGISLLGKTPVTPSPPRPGLRLADGRPGRRGYPRDDYDGGGDDYDDDDYNDYYYNDSYPLGIPGVSLG